MFRFILRGRMARRPGIALLNALLLTMASVAFLLAATRYITDSSKEARISREAVRASEVARYGLEQALAYMRRAPLKPIRIFDPTGSDTQNEAIGLVRDYEIDPARNLWGRFELGRSPNAPARGSLSSGAGAGGVYPNPPTWVARDVSAERGRPPGEVWAMQVRGYTYITPTPGSAGFSPTLKSVKSATVESEFFLTRFTPRPACFYVFGDPSGAEWTAESDGYCGKRYGHIQLHSSGGETVRLDVEEGYALSIWSASDTSKLRAEKNDPAAIVEVGAANRMAPPATSPYFVSTSLTEQLRFTFGVSTLADIQASADYIYDINNPIPAPMPRTGIIYIDAKGMNGTKNRMDFSNVKRLGGEGVLFVDGNLRINGKIASQSWEGLIFTTGNFEANNDVFIKGAVICGGKVRFHCTDSGHTTSITYSRGTLDRVLRRVSNYREAHTARTARASAAPLVSY